MEETNIMDLSNLIVKITPRCNTVFSLYGEAVPHLFVKVSRLAYLRFQCGL